jgi:hypothetical protein
MFLWRDQIFNEIPLFDGQIGWIRFSCHKSKLIDLTKILTKNF